MTRMDSMVTLRLPDEDVKVIEEISVQEKTDKSSAIRELIELGKVYFAILNYREEKISLGKAAEISGLTISQMIDVLANLGIESRLEVSDYLRGAKTAEELF